MEVNSKNIELDPEGYLVHPEDWDHDVAVELAKTEDLELDDEYWKVFDFMREYYDEHGVPPDVRHTTKHMIVDFGLDKKGAKAKLFSMFPYGYVKQACKASGMKRPRGWSTG